MDLSASIIPKSDQLNADEMVAGPATYTIREVIKGSVEQPFDFLLVETDRAYRPSKTMRRVIVNAWGPEAANYAGRRLTLYREPTIKFGGQEVGGIRISHMSHIAGPVELMAQTTRGKREKFTVQPLDAVPLEAAEDDSSTKALLAGMSAHQKGELYQRCGIERSSKLAAVKSKLCAAYIEWGWINVGEPCPDEPDPVAVLAEFQRLDRENRPADGVEEFDRFAKTGEDTSPGGQTSIAGEVLA